ncbi:MAG: UDP-N-acetylmuramoyl-L-alanyl-D-glutamate--2,6-diaminopimelate ligase [Flavobacteriales bacterium]|nr:UDP-N-acetylmuramoyl-L-alanyl-D-glutamate--2,6-diaminopimelate ligase [Flavobacteriales bacterium]
MRNLIDILYGVAITEVIGDTNLSIKDLSFDSRKVEEGFCYIAQEGTQVDGHAFIKGAIQLGAIAVVCEKIPATPEKGITFIRVKSSGEALGIMASNFFDNPSSQLKLVGVTGTNGKTTTVTLLHQLFGKLGHKVGLISTVVNKIGETEIKSTHTTPDAIQLNGLLNQMVEEACEFCFMEVSSHAIIQNRIAGLGFEGGVFTNITHEHLDFHKTFKEYIKAKRAFFNVLGKSSFALSNKDDKNGQVMLQETAAGKHYYALKTQADFKTKVIESDFEGLSLKIDDQEFWSPFIGHFNAYNLTAVYGTAMLLGEDKVEVLTMLSALNAVAGRFQHIKIGGIAGIVDYAHSPDALENVLKTIKDIRTGNEEVITVVGCGGDRDRSKRPLMAAIACKLSDKVILTSDNPRTENAETIIEEMKAGVDAASKRKVLAITNRKEAIRTASSLAQSNDILLVAGKGHENYQEINGERFHFDDLEILSEALNENHQTK